MEKADNTYSIDDTDILESSSYDQNPGGDIRRFGDNYHSDKYYYMLATGEDPHDLRRVDEGIFRQPYMDPHTSEVGRWSLNPNSFGEKKKNVNAIDFNEIIDRKL